MQILEENDDFGSNQVPSFKRNGSLVCIAPFLLIDSFSRKSISYDKLPQEPLRLTILKLDGNTFDIEVAKNATVAELKQAVEAAFRHLPNISWSHVWGHFCLFYDGQKLLADNDDLGLYGIKDGDQLEFVRHVSINYNMRRTNSEKGVPNVEKPTVSDVCEGGQQNFVEYQRVEKDIELGKASDANDDDLDEEEDSGVFMTCENKLTHLFRGWFSYRKLSNSNLVELEEKSSPSRFSNTTFLASFKNVARIYNSKKYDSCQRETCKVE